MNIDTLWMSFKPFHPDCCNHGENSYRGSIQYQEGDSTVYLDVYVYISQGKQKICIRYGAEGSEYYSPIDDWAIFIANANSGMRPYAEALKVLQYTGKFVYQPAPNLKELEQKALSNRSW